jgi:hypothetical protein
VARQVEFAIVIATVARLLIPLLMLRWPLPGVLLSIAADLADWNFLNIQTAEANAYYQNWDRIMDMWFWIVSIPMVLKWEDALSRFIAFAFLGFRLIGQALFFLTQDRSFLFFFPNFYDNFLVLYLGYVQIFKRTRLIESPLDALVIAPFLLVPKVIHEYFLHFLQLQPWERFDIGNLLGLAGIRSDLVNVVLWGGLFYVLPFLAVFLYFRWKFRNSGAEWSKGRRRDPEVELLQKF